MLVQFRHGGIIRLEAVAQAGAKEIQRGVGRGLAGVAGDRPQVDHHLELIAGGVLGDLVGLHAVGLIVHYVPGAAGVLVEQVDLAGDVQGAAAAAKDEFQFRQMPPGRA